MLKVFGVILQTWKASNKVPPTKKVKILKREKGGKMSAWVLLKLTQNNWGKATRDFFKLITRAAFATKVMNPKQETVQHWSQLAPSERNCCLCHRGCCGPSLRRTGGARTPAQPLSLALIHENGFFPLLPKWKCGSLKSLGKYECEGGHTMSFKVSTTKVLLSGFYLIEMSLPFHWVSSFCVLCYCVL